ncbi:MAG: cobalamin-binding protein [Armatimonadetes bacterium]|nr:cobalamin-binding protein [Armatimonadota bacterium]NIO75179.1 cobalamin-binding protein [Armatimonadota bacterium]NIO98580.1 cobalamin-binding protein [Armatimonadota bacterium]
METVEKAILEKLARAVVDMDEEAAVAAADQAIEQGVNPNHAISEGLSAGMREVGELYERGEYFVPEILICSDAMYAAIEVLKPHIKISTERKPVKVIIGVIEGDIHDLGKNIVKIMLEAGGFEVQDLGRDVKAGCFVDAAKTAGKGIIALSTLMSTTMDNMAGVVQGIDQAGLREGFAIMVGGGPTSPTFAKEIGADAHGSDASDAVELAKSFAARMPCQKTV